VDRAVSPTPPRPARPKNQFEFCIGRQLLYEMEEDGWSLQVDAEGYLSRNDIEESGAARLDLISELWGLPMD
jgi:hypothetical protein